VDKSTANNPDNYTVTSYTYKYHPVYGSPIVDFKENAVRGAKVSTDGLRARIVVDSLRLGYVHDIKPEGLRSYTDQVPLLHGTAYYTLNSIPAGPNADFPLVAARYKLSENEPVKDAGAEANTPDNQMKEARPTTEGEKAKAATKAAPAKTAAPKAGAPANQAAAAPAQTPAVTEREALTLLTKHTCAACHKINERSVGPPYTEVAKRKYSVAQIVSLVQNPKPEHWPDYTPMAPMAHVPKKDIEKIAVWINSLRK
jgi:cytochrome c551/c552